MSQEGNSESGIASSSQVGDIALRPQSKLLSPAGKVLILGAMALLGTVFSIGAFRSVRHVERQEIESSFRQDAEERVSAFRVALTRSLGALTALRAFFAASVEVTPEEFREFASHLLQADSAIQGLGWDPQVLDSEREAFEATYRRSVRPDFEITERSAAGEMMPVARRERYVVVTYIEPYEGNERALGFDIASDPVRLAALRQAEASREVAITAGIRLVQEGGEELGLLAVLPVFAKSGSGGKEDEAAKLLGFLVAVLKPIDIFETALQNFAPRGLRFSIHDVTAGGDDLLHVPQSRLETVNAGQPDYGVAESNGFLYQESLAVAGRRWSVRSVPIAEYVAKRGTWAPLGTLCGGLVFTGLLVGFVAFGLGRMRREREQAEQLLALSRVLGREAESHRETSVALTESEGRYRGVVEAMFEGLVVSEQGILLEVSDSFAEMFGYPKSEITGQPALKLVAPEERERVASLMRAGFDRPYESICVKKDGTVFPVEVCGREAPYKGRRARVSAVRDLTVPGSMGGREAVSRLLEIDPAVRAVVSSGYSNDPVMADYREHGFCGVMVKPYRLEDVAKVLSQAMNPG